MLCNGLRKLLESQSVKRGFVAGLVVSATSFPAHMGYQQPEACKDEPLVILKAATRYSAIGAVGYLTFPFWAVPGLLYWGASSFKSFQNQPIQISPGY